MTFAEENLEMVVQLALAVALSGAIGLEREWRGRAAGLRTMVLVAVGSTTMMLASAQIAAGDFDAVAVSADPTRVAAGIITGVGFLGAGVILKLGDVIRGVTTAAAIWFVAGLGIVVGCKNYVLATLSTVIVLVVLLVLHYVERLVPQQVYRKLRITVASSHTEALVASCRTQFDELSSRLSQLRLRQRPTEGVTEVEFQVRTTRHLDPVPLVKRLSALEGVQSVGWL